MESRFGGCLPFDEFVTRCTHFPLKEILHAYGVTDSRIRAVFPQYIELLDEIYTEENLPALKAYLLTHTAYSAYPFLDLETAGCLIREEETDEDFYTSPYAKKDKAPVLILTLGRDTWAVDTRWMFDGALKRGIHCLAYDGPGQGYALRFQDMKFRPDWEKVMGPVLDYAETIDCVDMNHVACVGFSFGGFLMPRVAAFDKRIKLIIADPGNISWGKGIGERLAMIQKMPPKMRPKFMNVMLEDYAWKHGVPEEAVVDELKKYDNSNILDKVECEVLVLDGTAEMTFGAAKELYDALPNARNKDYILFDDDSTAQCHTQMGGYATGAEIIMDWLEDHI